MDRRQLLIAGSTALALAVPSRVLARAPDVAMQWRGEPVSTPRNFRSGRMTVGIVGKGPDVILVPGLSSSPTVWRGLVDHLKDRYRFHLVQIRGFAGADKGDNTAGPVAAPVAEEIARYVTATGLKRPAVIGHSMGGTIAMMLAARHPDLVGKAMVIDMPPFLGMFMGPPGATAESMKPMAEQVRQGMAEGPLDAYRKRQDETIAGMVKSESARGEVLAAAHASDRDVSARAYAELMTTDLRPELSHITAPLTVLYAWTPQYPMPAEQLDKGYAALFASVRGARTIRIPDSYHFVMLDQPQRFEAEVVSFLGS